MTPAIAWRRSEQPGTSARAQQPRTNPHLVGEDVFRGVLARERKRADWSDRPLLLVLVAVEAASQLEWRSVVDALSAAKRDTDIVGWLEYGAVVGLLLPEVPASDPAFLRELNERVRLELAKRNDGAVVQRVSVRLRVHSEEKVLDLEGIPPVETTAGQSRLTRLRRMYYNSAKRAIDIVGSLVLLALLSPLFLVIAILVKLKSPGPVFFHQERIGQNMKPFMMLKFRTMYVKADHAIHQEFVSSFIKSRRQPREASTSGLFKIANDPRVTPIGGFLRRTSLDEIPQFLNVLRGEMSLVGPRPPLRYEVDQYKSWHKRRVLETKPGVTGLWQVSGRSRTTFDEMVRLDLRYARTNSVWNDIKILLATPRAVISGKDAC